MVLSKSGGGTAPKAFLNFITFDADNNPILTDPSQTNYVGISEDAKEDGTDVAHERLFAEIHVKKAGLMYIYLSNDNVALGGSAVDVFFDDFKVEHVHSKAVQSEDYYPFGLTFNSYSRENSVPNKYQYNGKELQDELNLGWYDYKARQYDPVLGRFLSLDPLAEISRRWSPYVYAYDNPIRFVDPDGMVAEDPNKKTEKLSTTDLSLDPDGVQQVTQTTRTITTEKNVDKNGKVTYTRTTTESSATNTIRAEVKDGKTTWEVEQGDVTVTSSSETIDKKGNIISQSDKTSNTMSQSEYKQAYGGDGGKPLYNLETTSNKVATLSTQFQQKHHSVIMDKIKSANGAGQFIVDQVNKVPINLFKSSVSSTVGKGPINFVSYHSVQDGSEKPRLLYYSNQNTGQHYDYYNPFGY